MKALLIGLLFALPVFGNDEDVEKIIYVRDGQATTLWQSNSEEIVKNTQKPCLQNINVRIATGEMLTTKNPYYQECVNQQLGIPSTKVNAQERGGEN